ncbi:MAG: hypothetical protein ACRETF_07475 [Nevskiaceae bacterium]
MPYGIEVEQSTDYWSNYFSEEDSGLGTVTSEGWYRYDGDNYEVCHRTNTAGVVTGIACTGRYCDNISIECGRPVKYKAGATHSARLTNCGWPGWYSEEQGSGDHFFLDTAEPLLLKTIARERQHSVRMFA